MAELAQLDLPAKGAELRTKALIEDLLAYHMGVYPGHKLALAVWFGKSTGSAEHNILELFDGPPMDAIHHFGRQPLDWKTGSGGPPFAMLHATSVDYFSKLMAANPDIVKPYFDRAEVLYFDKHALTENLIRAFNIINEPSGLMKGWYLSVDDWAKFRTLQAAMASCRHVRPDVGFVKIEEFADLQGCRGLLHVEVEQRWLPLSPGGLQNYTFYHDVLAERRGYFLFEGGALYRIVKFEVITAPEYSRYALEKSRDDRYPEVYLRAVHPPEQSAA